MRRFLFVLTLAACDRGAAPAQPATPAPAPASAPAPVEEAPSRAAIDELTTQRQQLMALNKLDQTEQLCTEWIARSHPLAKAEGHKCLANVLVRRGQDGGGSALISGAQQRLAVGELAAAPRFSGESVGQAIDQLDQAALLNPSDLSVHQGRLFMVLASGEYARAVTSLEASLNQLPSAPVATWLEYANSFPMSASEHAIAYARLLATKYPESGPALTQLGAWLVATHKVEEGMPLLEKAVALDDRDAMAHWRLAEALVAMRDQRAAFQHFARSVELPGPLAAERKSAFERIEKSR